MSEQRSSPAFDPALDKHDGSTPAMNRDRGGDAAVDADRDPAPGNVERDVPEAEAAESIEGAVRAGANEQNGEVAKLPGRMP